jgi:hypothetical protein
MSQGQFPGVLDIGDLLKQGLQGRLIDEPLGGHSGHDGGGGPFGEGVEDGGQGHVHLRGNGSPLSTLAQEVTFNISAC